MQLENIWSLGRRRSMFALFIICLGISTFIYWKLFHNYTEIDFFDRQKIKVRPILWWNAMPPNYESKRFCGIYYCEFNNNRMNLNYSKAVLFYGSSMKVDDFPLPRPPNQTWALFHEESPRNVPFLMSNATLQHFNTTSTFSRYSDFPITTHYLPSEDDLTSQKYFVSNKRNTNLAPIAFLQSDCDTLSKREDYVQELMRHIRVDSYGSCFHNRDLPQGAQNDYLNNLFSPALLSYLSKYYFIIAIENGVCHDYITEKFWRPLIVGSIPIYYGSPSIRDWEPNNKSAIYVEDFKSPKALAEFLYKLIENRVEYHSYFDHKFNSMEPITNKRLRDALRRRSYDNENLLGSFECHVCQEINKKQKKKKVKIVDINHYNCPLPPPHPPMTSENNESLSKSDWDSIIRLGQCQAQVLNELLYRNVPFTKKTFDSMINQRIKEGFYSNNKYTCAKN